MACLASIYHESARIVDGHLSFDKTVGNHANCINYLVLDGAKTILSFSNNFINLIKCNRTLFERNSNFVKIFLESLLGADEEADKLTATCE